MSTVIVESLTSPSGRVVSTDLIATRNPMLSSQLPTLTAVGEYAFLTDLGQNAWFRGNGAWSTNEKYTAVDQIIDYDFMTHQYKRMESYGIVPTTLANAVTVSRAGTALYSSPYDGLESASANTARIEYSHQTGLSGLLCEHAITNLALYSNDQTNASWGKLGLIECITSAILSPDNVSSTTLIREDVANSAHQVWQTVATNNSNLYGLSTYAKPGASDYVVLQIIEQPSYVRSVTAIFDVRTGQVVVGPFVNGAVTQIGASIEKANNGWFKISLWGVLGGSDTNVQIKIGLSNGIFQVYAGDGVRSVYVWGAQFEQKGQGCTTLAQTTTAAVIRNEDVIYQDTPYMNAEQGTIFVDFTLESYEGGQGVLVKLTNTANQTQRGFGLTIDSGALVCRIRDSGVSNSVAGPAVQLYKRYRAAITYSLITGTTFKIGISVNGSTPTYATVTNSMESLTGRLYFNGGTVISGTQGVQSKIIHRLRAFSRALSEYELRLLTA